jgi:hypothetical protein
MPEALKKVKRKIRGKPEPTLLIDETDSSEFDEFRDGRWLKKPNVDARVTFNGKQIFENPPICPACGEKVSAKEIAWAIEVKGSLWRQTCYVATTAEFYTELGEVYDKIRNGKIELEEAFEKERLLKERFFEGKPESERPGIQSAKGNVPLDCSKCEKRLGLIEVSVKTKVGYPYVPEVREWLALKKSPIQMRLIKEEVMPEGASYETWITGEDMGEFIKKLEAWRDEVEKIPLIRELYRPLSNLSADIGTAITKIKLEIQTRESRVYNLLRNPPMSPPRTAKPEPPPKKKKGLSEESKRVYEKLMKKIGARPIARR